MTSRLPLLLVLAGAAGCATGTPAATAVPPGLARWDSLAIRSIAPGVRLVSAWSVRGPWAAHTIEIDLDACRPTFEAPKAGPPLAARATTSALAADAVAAINADFFMLPGGTPVGAHVSDDAVLAGPGRRHVFAITEGSFAAGVATLVGWVRTGTDSTALVQVNRPLEGGAQHPPSDGIVLYTAWYGDTVSASADAPVARIRPFTETGSSSGRGVVLGIDSVGPAPLDRASIALRAGDAGKAWLRRRTPGDTVAWQASVLLEDAKVRFAVGGFPLLVRDGRDVTAEQQGVIASFGAARHPRTAVGWDASRLLWVVVDGRQPGWSDGMTLAELADFMIQLGARHAINLDGGGSSALVVRGAVVNRPSDATGEREVANALALARCDAGTS